MKNKELIRLLQELPEDMEVWTATEEDHFQVEGIKVGTISPFDYSWSDKLRANVWKPQPARTVILLNGEQDADNPL